MEQAAQQPRGGATMEWVVVLEAVLATPPHDEDVQRLLGELAEFDPLGMRCDERYALQLRVLGGQPEEALTTALARWRGAAEHLFLGTATVVRSEVMTRGELELDLRAADTRGPLIATATAIQRDPVVRPERVVPAVLSVLAGGDPEEIAHAAGVHPLQLVRWCDLFLEGGRLRLAGASSSRRGEQDARFFDLLKSECRRTLDALSRRTRELAGSVRAPGGEGEAWAEVAFEIEGLRQYADELTEAVAATQRDMTIDPLEVDVARLVVDVVSEFNDGRVVVGDSTPVPAFTDEHALRRATGDLVSCALEVADGKPVQLSVGVEDAFATVELRSRSSADPHVLRALFEPFGTDHHDGNGRRGLGLLRCRALVVALGGNVGVTGEDDALTFWLRVPRRSEEGMETG